jgi:hypothetical protein
MVKKFPANIHKQISNYIYAIYDPKEALPFYVGRGVGDRVFSHLKNSHNKVVDQKVASLRSQGFEPIVKILIHGLNSKQAKAAETVAIAMLGKDVSIVDLGHTVLVPEVHTKIIVMDTQASVDIVGLLLLELALEVLIKDTKNRVF